MSNHSEVHTYRVASHGTEADYPLHQILQMWRTGEISPEAQYRHPCGQWKPLAPLILPRIQEADRAAQMRGGYPGKKAPSAGAKISGAVWAGIGVGVVVVATVVGLLLHH